MRAGSRSELLRRARPLVALALIASVVGPLGCGSAPDAPLPPPGRILLFSLDTVRADFVEGWGGRDTPHIRALAEEGVRFRDSFAASSYTLPSHMSLFTGLDPEAHGVLDPSTLLSPRIATLAELLREAGFRTQAFHEGGYMSERYGFARGFDAYEQLPNVSLVRENLPRVLSFMREAAGEPYFLFLHTYAAHSPFGGYDDYREAHPERGLPPVEEIQRLDAAYRREDGKPADDLPEDVRGALLVYNQLIDRYWQRARSVPGRLRMDFVTTQHFRSDIAAVSEAYRRRIQEIDAAIGAIDALLAELGQRDDTLWILTSDHGEAFFEHGLYSHGHVPFEEVLRVPLLFRYPPLTRAGGRVVTGPVWHLDIRPTILSLSGLDPAPSTGARDLRDALAGTDDVPSDRALFPLVLDMPLIAVKRGRRVVLRDGLKWIQGHRRFGDPNGLLFDLAADPGERRNLRRARPGDARELAALLEAYEADLPAPPTAEAPAPLTGEDLEGLRKLGYVE